MEVDAVDMTAYMGLLILVGIYRSRHEATTSLWDEKTGRAMFSATMSRHRYLRISGNIRFDDQLTRPGRKRESMCACA